jgi:excisionase family DNA binding protein
VAEEKMFTVAQVAERLQVGEQTVRRWIRDGELGAVKLERSFRITETDLDEFFQARRTRLRSPLPAGEAGLRPAGRPVLLDGRRLKKIREEKGISVRELARDSGVSESWIYSIQRGPRRGIYSTTTTAKDLAEVLGVDPSELRKS